MPTPNLAEYLEVAGVPLSTKAWEVEDLSPLWDMADVIGEDAVVPYRRGVVPFRRALGSKRVDLPMVIVGLFDSDGNPIATGRDQLWLNRRELIRTVLRPLEINTGTGDTLVRYFTPGTEPNLSGPGKVIGGLKPTAFGPDAFKASLSLSLSEGGLRSETETDVTSSAVAGGGFEDFAVPNAGDGYQDALLLDLTGTCTSVKLTNKTADPNDSVFWEFGGALDAGVAADTSDYTAVRGGISVVGLVTFGGFERWLPLVPGTNTIRIEPLGGTAQVRFRHFPFFP
jgi:hypothetical protein